MPTKDLSIKRRSINPDGDTLMDWLRCSADFGFKPTEVAIIRGTHVHEEYSGDDIGGLFSGHLMASKYKPTSIATLANGAVLVFMDPYRQP